MIRQYKEILFGLAFGLAMWVVDAAMHAQIGSNEGSWAGSFIKELPDPESTPQFFGVLFLSVSMSLGFLFWRCNRKHRQAKDVEQELRSLRRAMTSPVMAFALALRAGNFDQT